MKNVKNWQLQSAFIFELDQFTNILKNLFGESINVEYALDGITVYTEDDIIERDDIIAKLTEYFDVIVTGYHQDDCANPFVWVVYREVIL